MVVLIPVKRAVSLRFTKLINHELHLFQRVSELGTEQNSLGLPWLPAVGGALKVGGLSIDVHFCRPTDRLCDQSINIRYSASAFFPVSLSNDKSQSIKTNVEHQSVAAASKCACVQASECMLLLDNVNHAAPLVCVCVFRVFAL
jgi:hypothetical protein